MTYGVTWGEGDGAGATTPTAVIRSSVVDTIVNTDVETAFSSQISITTELIGVEDDDAIRIIAKGVYGTYGIANSLTISLYNAGTLLLTTGAQTLPANMDARGWWLDGMLIQTAGATNAQGHFMFSTTGRAWDAMDMENAGNIAVSLGSGILYITATWGAADAANTITMRQFIAQRFANG